VTDPSPQLLDDAERQQPTGFSRAARRLTDWCGTPGAAGVVAGAALAWAAVGKIWGSGRTWELVVTAGLPFLTLLMLVLVQHTQNHHDKALQLKLDELIRASAPADNKMMSVEDAAKEDLEEIRQGFQSQAT